MEKGPVMNTGPDKVGRGRKRLGGAAPWRGRDGRAVVVLIRLWARTQTRGAHLRTAHPKVRTQKKCLTLETYRASAPRIHLKPGWNRGPGGASRGAWGERPKRRWSQAICRPYVPPAYRFYASEPVEMSRLKFNVFCGLSCVFTTLSRGIAPGVETGGSGTFSLRFVFV